MKGLGLVDLIYNFEKQIVQMYGIENVCTEPVNDITDKKFKEIYQDYKIEQKDNYICASIK
jgi:ABC-type phosphate/phosphonate transport system ATPase subunit